MLRMDADKRRALAELKAQVREIERPEREARKIQQAKMRAQREKRPARIAHERSKTKGGHIADKPFMAWQHASGLLCVACEIEGQPTAAQMHGLPNPIEVAHQRVKGWKKGVKGDDEASCPLCRWHHQLAPNACDKGQKAFWGRMGIDVSDYCAALYAAFKGGSDGRRVQLRFIPRRPRA